MAGRDPAEDQGVAGAAPQQGPPREILDALVQLASGDFTVRLQRNYQRDAADTLAYFVNLMAEELGRLLENSERGRKRLEEGVAALSDVFLQAAAGDFSVRAPRDGSGDPLDVLGFLLDNLIAELGETFADLEHQRGVLQGTFDSMADAVIIVGPGGRVEAANGETSRLLGWPAQSLSRLSISDLLGGRSRRLAEALTGGKHIESVQARPTDFVDASGKRLQLSVSLATLDRSGEEANRYVLVARDERELQAAREQLQLTDRMATMGTLAAGVAHEINNPLAFVISNLEFAVEELEALEEGAPLPRELLGELIRALGSSKSGAERIADIVRDLKSLSRVDDDSLVVIELERVIDSAANMLKNDIRHRARLIKTFGKTPRIRANEARVMQVALNLLQNAAQAIPVGRVNDNQIRVKTSTSPDGDAVLTVSDTGKGIPVEQQHEIFEAFYTTKPLGEGTGLGLSICQRLVDQLGGRIEVDSTVGEGTTFRVYFPPGARAESQELQGLEAPEHPVDPVRQSRRRRILVVDDEIEIGNSVHRALADEHDVDVVTDGPSALELFGGKDYDLVLIDWMMPEMSGSDLYDALSARYPDHGARLIVMSGGNVTTPRDRDEGEFLEKPFSPTSLRRLIERIGD